MQAIKTKPPARPRLSTRIASAAALCHRASAATRYSRPLQPPVPPPASVPAALGGPAERRLAPASTRRRYAAFIVPAIVLLAAVVIVIPGLLLFDLTGRDERAKNLAGGVTQPSAGEASAPAEREGGAVGQRPAAASSSPSAPGRPSAAASRRPTRPVLPPDPPPGHRGSAGRASRRGVPAAGSGGAAIADGPRTPVLRWKPVPKATYYNVILWRGGKRVLDLFVTESSVPLPASWRKDGRLETLTRGRHLWFVYPGFGERSRAKYGALAAHGRLDVAG